jgi:hypothetical protein
MKGFVRINLAERKNDREFIVFFKYIHGDPIERFSKHRTVAESPSEEKSEQLSFFDENSSIDD